MRSRQHIQPGTGNENIYRHQRRGITAISIALDRTNQRDLGAQDGIAVTKTPTSNDSPSTVRTVIRYALYGLTLIAAVAPTVLLLAFSSDLSTSLGERGCLPNSDFDFVLRYTRSIWDFSQFFAITINFAGPIRDSCTTSGTGGFDDQGQSVNQVCNGYTYTAVKVIDIAFDIMVGRMGQLALATFAYRLSIDALQSMMQRGQIGYDILEAVHFQDGSLSSVLPLLEHAIGSTPVPRTTQAKWTFIMVGLASLYIVSFPTLVSAMSGYTSYFVPSIRDTICHALGLDFAEQYKCYDDEH